MHSLTHSLTHSLDALRALPVAGPGDNLRDLVRAAYAGGQIDDSTLRAHGVDPSRFGGFIASAKKIQCLALLTGEPPAHVAPVAASGDAGVALAAMIAPHLAALGVGGVTPDQIAELEQGINDRCALALDAIRTDALAAAPVRIEIKALDGTIKPVARQHYIFPALLAVASARINAFIVGPAGSGKSQVAHSVADALGLAFSCTSFCSQTTKSDLVGYHIPGTGEVVRTAFRERYEHGGVWCADELDNGNANVISVLNSATSNGEMSFPDGTVKRHPDFILIATANTFGSGADRLYSGRNQLDAATLDRFAFLAMPLDEGMEMHMCGIEGEKSPALDIAAGGLVTDAREWVQFVQAVRAAVDVLKLRVVISPRASKFGVTLAAFGFGREWLQKMLIWKGLKPDEIAKINAQIGGAQ